MVTPWTPLRRLAIGGTAELWLAAGRGGQTWVIKQLFPEHGPEARAALAHERALLERIDSPYVVRCLDGGDDWLALEWIDGVDTAALASHARRRGAALPAEAAVEVLLGACRGLVALHAAGYVHGDLSPGNVLLGRDGRVVLADLGQAAPRGASAPSGPEGTLLYQPPEQLLGAPRAPTMDLYALALGVYELVTGTLARPAGMLGLAELMAARTSAPLPAASVRPGVPAALDRLLLPALDPDPALRPPSAEAWLAAVQSSGLRPARDTLVSAVEAAARRAIPATATAHEQRAAPVPPASTRAGPSLAPVGATSPAPPTPPTPPTPPAPPAPSRSPAALRADVATPARRGASVHTALGAPAAGATTVRGEPPTHAATTVRGEPPTQAATTVRGEPPTQAAALGDGAHELATRVTDGGLARDHTTHDTTLDLSRDPTGPAPAVAAPRPASLARALAGASGPRSAVPSDTVARALAGPSGAADTLPEPRGPALRTEVTSGGSAEALPTLPTWSMPAHSALDHELPEPPTLGTVPDTWVTPSALTPLPELTGLAATHPVPSASTAPRREGARAPTPGRWVMPTVIVAVALAGAAAGLWLSRAPASPTAPPERPIASAGAPVAVARPVDPAPPAPVASPAAPDLAASPGAARVTVASSPPVGAPLTGVAPAAPPGTPAAARTTPSARTRPAPRTPPSASAAASTDPRAASPPEAGPPGPDAPTVAARRIVVAGPSCRVRVAGAGLAADAPARTEPRTEDTVLELASDQPAWRLIVRVDIARARATLGAPRGRFAQVACGQDPPRPTPLLALSLAGPLRCEVIVSPAERCAFTLLLQPPP